MNEQSTAGVRDGVPAVDVNLASTLFDSVVDLADKSTLAHAASDDTDARKAKLALGKQANTLKQALISLSNQANQLPSGSLSLDDQDWVIQRLEQELADKRSALEKLNNALSQATMPSHTSDNENAMQTD